jgi:hypothetical protein
MYKEVSMNNLGLVPEIYFPHFVFLVVNKSEKMNIWKKAEVIHQYFINVQMPNIHIYKFSH